MIRGAQEDDVLNVYSCKALNLYPPVLWSQNHGDHSMYWASYYEQAGLGWCCDWSIICLMNGKTPGPPDLVLVLVLVDPQQAGLDQNPQQIESQCRSYDLTEALEEEDITGNSADNFSIIYSQKLYAVLLLIYL